MSENNTRKTSNIQRIQMAAGFLQIQGLDHLDFGIYAGPYTGNIQLTIPRENLTDTEYRSIKRIFGPLEIRSGSDSKAQIGTLLMGGPENDDAKVTVEITRVYTCTRRTQEEIDEMTDSDWDMVRQQVSEGLISLDNCEAVSPKNGESF